MAQAAKGWGEQIAVTRAWEGPPVTQCQGHASLIYSERAFDKKGQCVDLRDWGHRREGVKPQSWRIETDLADTKQVCAETQK